MKKQENKRKSKNRKTIFVGGILLVFLLIVGISTFSVHSFYKPYYQVKERIYKIKSTKIEDIPAEAWLRVQGTDIDTPVVPREPALEGALNVDYLWLSPEYREGENRLAIYGHNIRNVSPYPDKVNPTHIRFEQLVSFSYYDFAKKNLYIQLSDGKEETLYKIYAVGFYDEGKDFGQSYLQTETEELNSYIQEARYNSLYDYDVDVDDTDELLTLITCTRFFGSYEKTQFKVDARRVRKNEKVKKYKVETNSNYNMVQ